MDERGSRRAFLRTLGGASVLGTAGCLGTDDDVAVLSAGSLTTVLDDHVGPRFSQERGTEFHGEYYGTNAVMRMIEERQKAPDVAISADSELLRNRLYHEHADWDVEFASNALGLAYTSDSWFGERLENGDPWYEAALDAAEGELAISDPDLDPLGYRAVQAFQLAESKHGLGDFTGRIAERAYREPEEPQLLAGVETGNRAAAIAYQNMAVDHDLPFYGFPDEYNFANPDYADRYASVSYRTDEGYTVEGSPIVYNATVLSGADNPRAGREFVRFLSESMGVLEENGLIVDGFPRLRGAVPEEVLAT